MKLYGQPVFHFVGRIERLAVRLEDPEIGGWFWPRLREAFPLALGAVLMPDHPHLVMPTADPEASVRRLNRMFGQLARTLGLRFVARVAEPEPIADRSKLLRVLRYLVLNPVRAGLAADPLEWWFSTHRDVVGATAEPWIDAERLASALRRRARGFGPWFHRYGSADPSVDVAGTDPPRPASPAIVPTVPLAVIARAAAAAHRVRPEAVRTRGIVRRDFVYLAHEQGWTDADRVALACGCTPHGIRKLRRQPQPPNLDAARLCLGDRRLLLPPFTRPEVPPRVTSGRVKRS